MNRKISYERFIEELLSEIPELKDIYEEHIKDCDEELPHIFMEDVFRYVKENINNGVPEYIVRLMKFLNEAMASSDENTKELISVSFLDNLEVVDNASLKRIETLLGSNLKKELKKIKKWKPK